MMSGSGLHQDMTPAPRRGPTSVIIVMTFVQMVEISILCMVVRSSWLAYKQSARIISIVRFLRSLTRMKKCFLISGTIILFLNTIFWVQILIPLRYSAESCSFWIRFTGRTCYSIGISCVYFFLWNRQYMLHSSAALKVMIPRWFYVLSKFSLILTIISFLFPLLDWKEGNYPLLAEENNKICYRIDIKQTEYFWLALFFGGTIIVNQFSYMILFYKTLKMHRNLNQNAAGAGSTNRLTHLARRCFYFTVLTVITDFVTLFGVIFIPTSVSFMYVIKLGKVDLMVNLVCMVFCFSKTPSFVSKALVFINCNRFGRQFAEQTQKQEMEHKGRSRSGNVKAISNLVVEEKVSN